MIAGNTDLAALYGTFAFLRLMQTQKPIARAQRLVLTEDQAPPPQLLGHGAPVRGQQRGGHRRPQRRERRGLRLRRDGRQRREEPARDPQPLRRRGARAGLARHQRHHDQQRQRQQRLPDERVHRAGGGAGRRAAPVRDPARALDPVHRADRQPLRARHADQRSSSIPPARRSAAGGRARRSSSRPRSPTSWASPSRPTPRASPARRTSATTTATGPTASAPPSRRWA